MLLNELWSELYVENASIMTILMNKSDQVYLLNDFIPKTRVKIGLSVWPGILAYDLL